MKKYNNPVVMIVLGATGDLMKKKIVPALYNLFSKNQLPDFFRIIGLARRDLDDQSFRNFLKTMCFADKKQDKASYNLQFFNLFSYQRGFLDDKNSYSNLGQAINAINSSLGICVNKLFYLAVAPNFYENVIRNLAFSGLSNGCGDGEGWSRIIIEKPFGKDLKTARRLERLIAKVFKEEQIYRIDHYLAKEVLQDILAFRFSNNLFDSNWGNKLIEKIEIKLWERIGVEERGNFYDSVGALRDIGQNHLLQMLALITMNRPFRFDAQEIRHKREEILQTILPLKRKEIQQLTFRAQYEGYRNIKGVTPHSQTETYFKSVVFLDAPAWRRVPIILDGGKRLAEQRKEIILYLKHSSPCFCPLKANRHYQNRIIFSLEPDEGIIFELWRKKPGLNFAIEKTPCFCPLRREVQRIQYSEEYEKLLYDCIVGDQTLFVSSREVEAMWRYIDPIVNEWSQGKVVLQNYTPDTLEPIDGSRYINDFFFSPKQDFKKEIAIFGLGKMGGNIALRLLEQGWQVYGYDQNPLTIKNLKSYGLQDLISMEQLKNVLSRPRIIWLMLPAGKLIDDILFGSNGLVKVLNRGDIIIDGGNSFYEDSIVRFKKLRKLGIHFLDVGVSGGPEGARWGAALMIGGEKSVFSDIEPLFKELAYNGSYQFFEGIGAGHFIKMIHNGIEYGMMQAIAEGFSILKSAHFKLDLRDVSEIYNQGSVIESRLIGWLNKALVIYGNDLKGVAGAVGYSGEGHWTIKTAHKLGVKAKIIEEAVKFRERSLKNPSYTGKILTALRNQFGGHSLH